MEKKNDWFLVNECTEAKGIIQRAVIRVLGFFGLECLKTLSDIFNEGYYKFVIDARDMDKKKLFNILEKIQTLSLLTFKGEHKVKVYIKLDLWASWGVEYRTRGMARDKIEELNKKCWQNIDILFRG